MSQSPDCASASSGASVLGSSSPEAQRPQADPLKPRPAAASDPHGCAAFFIFSSHARARKATTCDMLGRALWRAGPEAHKITML